MKTDNSNFRISIPINEKFILIDYESKDTNQREKKNLSIRKRLNSHNVNGADRKGSKQKNFPLLLTYF